MSCKALSLLASFSSITLLSFSPVRSDQNDITEILSGVVNEMKTDKYGNLYASVNIKTGNVYNKAEIIKWNGYEWHRLNSQISGGVITTFEIDDFGNIYVGGSFKYAGGFEANGVAMWDGNSWKALGTGMKNIDDRPTQVLSIALDGSGNLYAGGTFDYAGDELVNNLAKWDGNTWSNLGNGVSRKDGVKGFVSSIFIGEKDDIYVCGRFANAGSVEANNIAKWDGNSWSSTIDYKDNEWTPEIVIDNSGKFYAIVGINVSVATYGKGTSSERTMWGVYIQPKDSGWKSLGGISESSKHSLMCGSEGDLYVINNGSLMKWDGQNWRGLDGISEVIREFHSYFIDNLGNIFVAGGTVAGLKTDVFYKWDGKTWQKLSNFTNEQTLIKPDDSFRKNLKSNSETRDVIYTMDGRQCHKIESFKSARGVYLIHRNNKDRLARRRMVVMK